MLRQIPIPPSVIDFAAHRRPAQRERVELMGVGVDRASFDDVMERVGQFVAAGAPRRIVTVNLDYLQQAKRDRSFRDTLNSADLAVADGMPLVWASKLTGRSLPERVTGLDLFEAICKRAAGLGWSVFFLGAGPNVAERAAVEMIWRFRGLKVVGAYAPPRGPFDAAEEAHIRSLIEAARPEVLFVALGAPRQDVWIKENLPLLGVPVSIGVGCAFDVSSGSVGRAPGWMRRSGFEWLFRLSREPGRLWRRYFLRDLPGLVGLVFSAARTGRRPASANYTLESGGDA